jgi:hypothetical protein
VTGVVALLVQMTGDLLLMCANLFVKIGRASRQVRGLRALSYSDVPSPGRLIYSN